MIYVTPPQSNQTNCDNPLHQAFQLKTRDENPVKEKFFQVEFVFNCADFSTSLQYLVKIENNTFDRQYHLLSQNKWLILILFSNQILNLVKKVQY